MRRIASLTLAAAVAAAPGPVLAEPANAAWAARCRCDPAASLSEWTRAIASAGSPSRARELAGGPLALARTALAAARALPFAGAAFADGERRLLAGERAVAAARSPAEAASAAAVFALPGASCHYSTGEIIAIVLGFILGVIPGLILLVLLC